MKKIKPYIFFIISFLIFLIITASIILYTSQYQVEDEDVVSMKRISNEASLHYPHVEEGDYSFSTCDFSILDLNGNVLYKTSDNAITDINQALREHYSTLSIYKNETIVGAVIVTNHVNQYLAHYRHNTTMFIILLFAFMLIGFFIYSLFLINKVIRPFEKLKEFANQIALGNLDFPLAMMKHNIFGSFTESFDIMRHELAAAKQKEALANQSKKELVASLSHDIKTPITSIKLTSELLMVLSDDEKVKEKVNTIYENAEHINALVNDLFQSTLEDLGKLKVTPKICYSNILTTIMSEADYLDKITLSNIPDCMIEVDTLRINQVISNIIQNSYKYAGTKIDITANTNDTNLEIHFKDYGPGVLEDELPLLFQKFYRGQNAESQTGSGLGLYLSKVLMNAMKGDIYANNAVDGFHVVLIIPLANK